MPGRARNLRCGWQRRSQAQRIRPGLACCLPSRRRSGSEVKDAHVLASPAAQAVTIAVMSTEFTAYSLPEEHQALRESVRELAEEKIAPHAAEVDQESRYPQEAYDALVKADLHAVHIPEAYGGAGADALATVIVIEEVARVCASSSLIPAVNKLVTVPLLLAGSEELKHRYLLPVARGEALFSYALSEAGAGSDAAGMKTRAARDGDHWVLNGTKMWITNAGVSQFYTVMAVTDPARGARGISAF